MAPVSYKCEISTPVDDLLPGDRMVVTPHLSDGGTPFNAQAVADKVRDLTVTYLTGTKEVKVRLYRDGAPKPNYPVATSVANEGTMLTSTAPRELAMCLSFYSTFNRPRQRGRIYIPWAWMASHTVSIGNPAARPSAQQIASAKDFAVVVLIPLRATVGANWTVWSPTDATMKDVTNYYVDDEWDIQRRRGRPPTSRSVGTSP